MHVQRATPGTTIFSAHSFLFLFWVRFFAFSSIIASSQHARKTKPNKSHRPNNPPCTPHTPPSLRPKEKKRKEKRITHTQKRENTISRTITVIYISFSTQGTKENGTKNIRLIGRKKEHKHGRKKKDNNLRVLMRRRNNKKRTKKNRMIYIYI